MKYLIKNKILLFFFLLQSLFTFSQVKTDSLNVSDADTIQKDSVSAETLRIKHRANRAALFSAVLPGLGQAYNKKYWKLPIIYGGAAALVYYINFNNTNYKKLQTAYLYRIDNDSTTTDIQYSNATDDDILRNRDYWRRNRDLLYIVSGLVYVLNIVDAYVDAQLSDFDISDDLTMHARPDILFSRSGNAMAGISLAFSFK